MGKLLFVRIGAQIIFHLQMKQINIRYELNLFSLGYSDFIEHLLASAERANLTEKVSFNIHNRHSASI